MKASTQAWLDEDAGTRSKVLPNPATCRTRRIGFGPVVAECLVKRAHQCPYAMSFGAGHFCKYPNAGAFSGR